MSDTDDPSEFNNRAILLKREGNFAEAEKLYLKAISRGNKEALANLGMMKFDNGDLIEGITLLEDAIDQGFELARLDIAARLFENFPSLLLSLIENHWQNDHNYAITFAELLTRRLRFKEAFEILSRYLDLNGENEIVTEVWQNIEAYSKESFVTQEKMVRIDELLFAEREILQGDASKSLNIQEQVNLARVQFELAQLVPTELSGPGIFIRQVMTSDGFFPVKLGDLLGDHNYLYACALRASSVALSKIFNQEGGGTFTKDDEKVIQELVNFCQSSFEEINFQSNFFELEEATIQDFRIMIEVMKFGEDSRLDVYKHYLSEVFEF